MSNPAPQRPGLRDQAGLRTAFRAAGVVLLVVALGFVITGLADFFSKFGSDGTPTKFWMLFVGIPLLGVAGWCLQAGFLGTASRYVAGETAPVLKDTAGYLTDGEGILGVGRTVDDAPAGGAAAGPFCSKCGVRNDVGAKFCDACGSPLH